MLRSAFRQLLLVAVVGGVVRGQDSDLFRASQLLGMEVRCATNDVIGEVKDVVLNRQTGGVAFAIVSDSKLPNRSGRLFAVPWQALTRAADRKALVLAISKGALANVPTFDPKRWPDISDPRWVAEVNAAYAVRTRPRMAQADDEPRIIGTRETVTRAPRSAAVVTGTVKSMHPGECSEVVIETDYGDIRTVLGPISYLDEQRLTFAPNAGVRIQGYGTIERDGPQIVATAAATHLEHWVKIRNNDLTPAWSDAIVDADSPRQVRDLTGTVTYAGNGVATVLTDDEGPRLVSLAPSNYFESRHWRLRDNRQVTVTGYDDPVTRNFVAITIDVGNETWRVRRDDGIPLWRDE